VIYPLQIPRSNLRRDKVVPVKTPQDDNEDGAISTKTPDDEEGNEYVRNEKEFLRLEAELKLQYPHEYVAFTGGRFFSHSSDLAGLARSMEEKGIDPADRFFARTDLDYKKEFAIL